jgi:class 3 adenylate cyclase
VPAALEILEAVADASLPPAHIGIHSGPVVFQAGDYFGRTVSLAARIGELAQAGQVLVSDEVAASVDHERFALGRSGPSSSRGWRSRSACMRWSGDLELRLRRRHRTNRKNDRISSTNRSGCSNAAK